MTNNRPARHHWWRGGVIYQVYSSSFADSDGDGIGDLKGLLGKLGYIADLGADAFDYGRHDPHLRDNPPTKLDGAFVLGVNPYEFQDHTYDKTQPELLDIMRDMRKLFDRCGDVATLGEVRATEAFLGWRKAHPALIEGAISFLDAPEPILAFVRAGDDEKITCAFNLSPHPASFGLPAPLRALDGHGMGGILAGREVKLPGCGAFFGAAH